MIKLKNKLFFILLFCFLISRIFAQQKNVATVFPESAQPGMPLTIAVNATSPNNLTASIVDANGKSIGVQSRFFMLPSDIASIQVSITAISSLAVPGQARIVIKNNSQEIASIPLTIEARDFVAEEIPLNPSNTAIRTEADPQKTRESDILWEIISTTGNTVYSNDEIFMRPVESTRKTSFYGDRRIYVYSTGRRDTSVHAGVDFGVPMKTPVKAAASGKVVFAAFRIVTGNSIIIEHFPGVYSLYYHLNDIHVTEGSMVNAGDEIGLSGTTGLSTGPHLHWEMRVATENADPDAFLTRKLLDKDAIISRMNGLIAN
jgi:murein DD-endopeptidase MepM/ murein hydrolase activator NlpD